MDLANGVDVEALYATDPSLRCQCKYGSQCMRAITGEHMRCDWCWGTDGNDSGDLTKGMSGHARACHDLERASRYGGRLGFGDTPAYLQAEYDRLARAGQLSPLPQRRSGG
jgi:hypothetical protein